MNPLENVFPIIVLGVVLEAVFVTLLLRTGRVKWFIPMGLVLITTVTLVFVERAIETPTEEIEAALHEIADSLEAGENEKVLSRLSREKKDVTEFKRAKAALEVVDVTSASIANDLKITVFDQQEPMLAKASLTIHVSGGYREFRSRNAYPISLQLWLRRGDDGKWIIYKWKRANDGRKPFGY